MCEYATERTDPALEELHEIIVCEMRTAMPGLPEHYREQLTLTVRVGRTEPQDGRGYFIDISKGTQTTNPTRIWHPLGEGDTDELAAVNGLHSMAEGLVQASDAYLLLLAIRSLVGDVPVSQLTDALTQLRASGVFTEMRPVAGDEEKFFTGASHAENN